mgnify:CR=1 FL=1
MNIARNERLLNAAVRRMYSSRNFYPDANSTLRVSYGKVSPLAPRDAVEYTPVTTVGGIIEKHTGQAPFDAPKALRDAITNGDFRGTEDPTLRTQTVNFMTNLDTTGGNSGSPVLDAQGRLIGLNFEQQKREADFRHHLVRVREYSEAIALDKGERVEEQNLDTRFTAVLANYLRLIAKQKQLVGFTNLFGQAAAVFPFIIAAPRFFSGAIQLGELMQIGNAFDRVQGGLSWFVDNYDSLAAWRATTERLTSFEAALSKENQAATHVDTGPAAMDIEATDLTLQLPTGATLLKGATLRAEPGQHTLVQGFRGPGAGGPGLRIPLGHVLQAQHALAQLRQRCLFAGLCLLVRCQQFAQRHHHRPRQRRLQPVLDLAIQPWLVPGKQHHRIDVQRVAVAIHAQGGDLPAIAARGFVHHVADGAVGQAARRDIAQGQPQRDRQQQERQLERTPGRPLALLKLAEIGILSPTPFQSIDAPHAL